MTSSNEQLVPVEQIDREAAASLLGFHINSECALKLLNGDTSLDDFHIVQAFTKHRLAALRTPPTPSIALDTIARTVEQWMEWSKTHRAAENLTTDADTAIMALPVPHWPTHGMLENWVKALRTPPAVEPDEGVRDAVKKALAHTFIELLDSELGMSATRTDCYRLADAAISAMNAQGPSIRAQALEEAAKVADSFADMNAGSPAHDIRMMEQGALSIATSIRALKGGQGV